MLSTHEDLAAGYDASLHITDPKGVLDPTVPADTHGTNVAGVIAARANNGLGGVGIAFDATLTSIKPLGDSDFVNLAMNELDRFDIASFSNGPNSLDESRSFPRLHFNIKGFRMLSTTAAMDLERS